MHIKGVEEVEKFCRDQCLLDNEVQQKLLLRKFSIKSNFILNKQIFDNYTYLDVFPEATGMWRAIPFSTKERIKFWLAEHHLSFILKLIS